MRIDPEDRRLGLSIFGKLLCLMGFHNFGPWLKSKPCKRCGAI